MAPIRHVGRGTALGRRAGVFRTVVHMVSALVRRLPLGRALARAGRRAGRGRDWRSRRSRVLVDRWTAVEAWAVGGLAGLLGSAEVTRSGHQLLVQGDAGTFVLTVGAWCSSLAPVLGVVAVAAIAPGAAQRRRGVRRSRRSCC